MTKKVISVKVDEISLYHLDGPIDDAIEFLCEVRANIKAQYPGSAQYTMSIEQDIYDPDRQVYFVYIKREETDEECQERISKENQAKKWRHDQYLRLKEEFEEKE